MVHLHKAALGIPCQLMCEYFAADLDPLSPHLYICPSSYGAALCLCHPTSIAPILPPVLPSSILITGALSCLPRVFRTLSPYHPHWLRVHRITQIHPHSYTHTHQFTYIQEAEGQGSQLSLCLVLFLVALLLLHLPLLQQLLLSSPSVILFLPLLLLRL